VASNPLEHFQLHFLGRQTFDRISWLSGHAQLFAVCVPLASCSSSTESLRLKLCELPLDPSNMPKERRQRIVAHDRSARISDRKFAVQENAVESVPVGSMPHASASEILDALGPEPQAQMTKKEKQQLKHQTFMERLELRSSPYSKSHARRLKRKAKEVLVTDFKDIGAVLSAMSEELQTETVATADSTLQGERPRPKQIPGKIGEGKDVPLTTAQRKKALHIERIRQPLIRTNATFSSNPFETIRLHAQNTLIKHEKPPMPTNP